ncbi:hypothetical protein EIP91_004205 [Steccherinum ochraceum]|uniref:UBC core domain-containing protein n=1 Tax=Steccherinum ochraceum TaxID=92696 RepID=A0A4R0RPQ2_9APHY|nr:hypothetical protein EIP91_004205 [Steccherinum ochraceum]
MVANTPLKGRKKFLADLRNACGKSYSVEGVQVLALVQGEDDGSMICEVADDAGNYLSTFNLLVPEPAEYPAHHQYYCFVQHDNPPEFIQDAASAIPDVRPPRTIEGIVIELLTLVAKHATGGGGHESGGEAEEDDDEDMMFDDGIDDDYGLNIVNAPSSLDTACLQSDFNEIVAAGYKPGSVRTGTDGFCLSVSVPVVSLANDISPQALMAWDFRLLSKSQHLTLLISGMRNSWPVLQKDGSLSSDFARHGPGKLSFRVGLTRSYKPSKDLVLDLVRQFSMQVVEEEQETSAPNTPDLDVTMDDYDPFMDDSVEEAKPENVDAVEEEESSATFHFSLSTSLESLMQERFLEALRLRLQFGLGWAAAEILAGEAQKLQQKAEDLLVESIDELNAADREERNLAKSYKLPSDPLLERQREDALNLPLLAFSYLLRRLTLCTRYCLICYKKLDTDFVALKPYVCDEGLCAYQYYNLNRGPSLEYEICTRPEAVELLLSLAVHAAEAGTMQGALPTGLGLVVPHPGQLAQMVEFDTLDDAMKARSVMAILKTLPRIMDIKRYLEKKAKSGRMKRRLRDMDPKLLPAAWLMLRWCVASCTAHLEELTEEEDHVRGIPDTWRQFRFIVGSPDAEAKLEKAKTNAAQTDQNARQYPSLYVRKSFYVCLHDYAAEIIIRHGLWFKEATHGRAYGHGVYFAKDYSISMGYSNIRSHAATSWPVQRQQLTRCAAVAEIVNLPSQFVSSSPYFVVQHTDWIVCRYLLVDSQNGAARVVPEDDDAPKAHEDIPTVKLDPKHPLTVSHTQVGIPEPSYRLHKLLEARQLEQSQNEDEFDAEDQHVFNGKDARELSGLSFSKARSPSPAPVAIQRRENDWQHDSEWVSQCMQHVLPPPADALPMATTTLQRELKNMLREQAKFESEGNLAELGWYMPEEFIGDNLFQWIVELHSFEETLPVANDMKARKVNSLVFEIRFPPGFPHAPPFFRILKPRFLPFSHGGGGHVTAGGSMCMDLLTADGWLPSYSIPAVLLQIKLAISNLDPRPGRLSSDWDKPYTIQESVVGFQRAAAFHGWRVPEGLERLMR